MKSGYKQTEVGVIPEDWELKTLADVADLQVGFAFKSAWFGTTRGLRLLRGENVGYGSTDWSDTRTLETLSHEPFREYHLRDGDVVIGMDRTFTKSGAKITLLREEDCPCLLVQRVGRFLPRECNARFLWFVLSSSAVQSRLRLEQKGMDIPHLSRQEILQPVVAIPSLPEQRAIATALSDVDALQGALDRLIAKKRDLKQAAMQQLLTGQTRLPGFHGQWNVKTLGDCVLSRPDYGINAAAVPYSNKLPSYLRITDISEHGRYCPDPRVSVKAASADQYYLQEGDVVFARTGASVGKSYLYDPLDGELVFAGFLIRIRPNRELLVPAFLAAYVTTKPYWNWVRLMSMRSGQPGINGNEYAQLPLQLPSLAEQTAIAEVLSDMDAEIAALEQRREKTRALKQGMMQELLTGKTRLV
jgi:type I restriction enzyme S subunit